MLKSMPTDFWVRLLSEWCIGTEIALLDTAMTNDTREWFLEKVIKHPRFVVNYHSIHDNPYIYKLEHCFRSLYTCNQKTRYENCLQWMIARRIRLGELCLQYNTFYYNDIILSNDIPPTASTVKALVLISGVSQIIDIVRHYENSKILQMFPNIQSFSAYKMTGSSSIPTTFANLLELALVDCSVELVSEICKVSTNVKRLCVHSYQSALIDYPTVHNITTTYRNLTKCSINFVSRKVANHIIELISLVLSRADSCIQMYKIGQHVINTGYNLPKSVLKVEGFSNVGQHNFIEELVDEYNAKQLVGQGQVN